jgi:hypothetical protein
MNFNDFVLALQNGDLHAELTEDLRTLAAALNQHFQDFRGIPKGEITLKFSFKMNKGVVEVLAKKTMKLPAPPEHGAILYVDANNGFRRDDPRQLGMFKQPSRSEGDETRPSA